MAYRLTSFQSAIRFLSTSAYENMVICRVAPEYNRHSQQNQTNESPSVETCNADGRLGQCVVSELEGAILRSRRSFPYYMLVAFEAGSPARALLLLVLSPLIWILQTFASEAAGIYVLIFIAIAGLKETQVQAVARAVLGRFYVEDLHRDSYRVVMSFGRRCVVTAMPRIMAEPFLMDFLSVDQVVGTELHTMNGFCTGLVREPGVLAGYKKLDALKAVLASIDQKQFEFHVGIGSASQSSTNNSFLSVCKEAYVVSQKRRVPAVPKEEYLKPLIFHDGRLVRRPTQLTSMFIWLWLPIGISLAYLRMIAWITLPQRLALPILALSGVKIRIKGAPPAESILWSSSSEGTQKGREGVLFVCTHKTVIDGMMLSLAIGKKTAAAIYSVSRVVEILMPMKTVRLVRNRERDADLMRSVLKSGQDLMVCPEGTTCRERYLLRFSPLFAELSDKIVPVGIDVRQSLFYGSTARGQKLLDPTYFFMNPSPSYFVHILDPLPNGETCGGGKSALDVANTVQKQLGLAMGYECTQLTRKRKYQILAGNDGTVPSKSRDASAKYSSR